MSDELKVAAKKFLLAKAETNKAYIRYWAGVKPCSDEDGWRLLEQFRLNIQQYVFKYKRGSIGVSQAANELFRVADDFHLTEGFVKWYGVLKEKIAKGIAHLYEFHGDGFGDLCDSLPLALNMRSKDISSTLETQAKKWWLYNFMTGRFGDEWTPAEQSAVSFASHGDE